MLKPEYLLHVSEGAEEIAAELHTRIIKAMVKRIIHRRERGDSYILTAQDKWQLSTLQEAGYLLEDVQKEIAKYTGYQAKEIARAMEEAGVTAIKYDDKIYEKAGIQPPPPLQQSPDMIRLMQRNYEKTMGTWENFTGTTANACHQAFVSAMDEAYIRTASGEVTYTKAYEDAIDSVCGDGLTITYPSGHTDTLETAALRCVRTGVSQSTAEVQLARIRETEDDLVIVSSHMGARPSHQEWQGQIYSMGANLDKYPDFYESTHYGEGDGLCGWNCRHHFSPYVEGMENPFEDYSNEENVKLYEDTQEQRKMERGIRKTKRAIEGYQEAIDTLPEDDPIRIHAEERKKALKAKLKDQRAAYKEFCADHEFRELPERLKIAKAKKSGDEYNVPDIIEVKPQSNVIPEPELPKEEPPKPEPMRPVTPPPIIPEPIPEPEPKISTGPMEWKHSPTLFGDEEDTKNIADLIYKLEDEPLKQTLMQWADTATYEYSSKSNYDPGKRVVNWGPTSVFISDNPYTSVSHEMGHVMDNAISSLGDHHFELCDKLTRAVRMSEPKDLVPYALWAVPNRKPSQSDEFIAAVQADAENLRSRKKIDRLDAKAIEEFRNACGISDFIDYAVGGYAQGKSKKNKLGIILNGGHGEKYWNRHYEGLTIGNIIDSVMHNLQFRQDLNTINSEFALKRLLRDFEGASELWANITMAYMSESINDQELALLEEYCPNAIRVFREILESHTKRLAEIRARGEDPRDYWEDPIPKDRAKL